MVSGAHRPVCPDLETHIGHAVIESEGFDFDLLDFVDRVRHDWDEERVLADIENDPDIRVLFELEALVEG